jgi:hypothetical protein
MTLTVVLYRETTLLRKKKCKLCIIVEQLFKLESWSSVQLRFLLHQDYKVGTMKIETASLLLFKAQVVALMPAAKVKLRRAICISLVGLHLALRRHTTTQPEPRDRGVSLAMCTPSRCIIEWLNEMQPDFAVCIK